MTSTPPDLDATLPDLDAFPDRVCWLVQQIPERQVATYGQIAHLAGASRAARAAGSVLKNTLGQDIPWHRVINAQGGISFRGDLHRAELQRTRLIAEGVTFTSWRCELDLFEWSPSTPYWATHWDDPAAPLATS